MFEGKRSCSIDQVVDLWQCGGTKDFVDGRPTRRYSCMCTMQTFL